MVLAIQNGFGWGIKTHVQPTLINLHPNEESQYSQNTVKNLTTTHLRLN